MASSENITPSKANFFISWLLANIIGLSFGWVLGELLGRALERAYGWKIGHLAGVVVFEVVLWSARGTVLARIKGYTILRPLDILIWVVTEIFGWLVNSSPSSNDNIMKITGGASFAALWGAMMWLVIWFIRKPKPGKKYWAIRAFFWTFLGFVGGSLFFTAAMATGLQIGYMLQKTGNPVLGMGIAGAILGGVLGIATGLAMLRLLRWPGKESRNTLAN